MKIAIAGYGLEGESNYRYWAADPANEITVVDQRQPDRDIPSGVPTIIGDDAFEKLTGFDLVIRTAGLAPRKIKTNGKIWSSTNEFFTKCPAPIIGVTGTKGKGTTASLIASIFEAAGKKVWLLGNIGIASLDSLSQIGLNDVVVYELSSFQLWDLERSPHAAVVLLVEPDHLNVHADFEEYVNAKSNIRRYQKPGDICVFHPTDVFSLKIAGSSSEGKAIRYGVPDDGGVYVRYGTFYQFEHKICSVDALQLIGNHNIENACAAISIAKFYDITDENIEAGLKGFHGLPHRIEYIREIDGVKYYNDSFSSAPTATIAAIKSFNQPEIIILGGIDKGADFTGLAGAIADKGKVKAIIVMGEIRNKLAEILKSANPNIQIEVTDLKTLQPIVELAKSYAQPGDVVVLSPGCASFDMFKDFYDRGNQFRSIVNSL
jgi:UDP-N-acetylmuramoylalanine--D-glutamate ligase